MSRFRRDRWSMNSTPSRWSISCWRQTASRPSISSSCGLALDVEPARADAVGAHRPRHIGRAPTGSPRCRAPPGPNAARISGLMKTRGSLTGSPPLFLRLLQVDDQEALRHADLDRGEADAGRVVHRLEHVGDERRAARRRPSRRAWKSGAGRGSGTSKIGEWPWGGFSLSAAVGSSNRAPRPQAPGRACLRRDSRARRRPAGRARAG